MARKESLISAYILDGKGGGKKVSWKEVGTWTPKQGVLWMHLDYTTAKASRWLKKESNLNKLTINALLVEESRPRSVINSEGILMFLRGVNLNPGQDPEDMVSIRCWIEPHRIITSRRRKLLSMTDLRESIEKGIGPKSSAEFLIQLNNALVNRIGDVINAIDAEVDRLEEMVLTTESRLLRPKITDIRRQAILIRRYLSPQREALYRLQIEASKFLSADDQLHIREINDRVVRYIEDLDASRDRATITHEELVSKLSEQLNQRLYVLAIVTVIFLPLAFITGLLGINVGGIPLAESSWGFIIVCASLCILLIISLWIFRQKKWM